LILKMKGLQGTEKRRIAPAAGGRWAYFQCAGFQVTSIVQEMREIPCKWDWDCLWFSGPGAEGKAQKK